jgi:hypothetical protein
VRAAVGRTHRSSPEPHPQPPPQRHGGWTHPEIVDCSREDDLSYPHEGPRGRCLDGPLTSPQYNPIVPDLPLGPTGMCHMLDRCEQKVSGPLTDSDHQLLALWAASCAEHVLDLFESARA